MYTRLISEQTQRLNPFGQNEQRFRWQNTSLRNHISTGQDISHFRIKRIKKSDSLEGGIGNFYLRNETIQSNATSTSKAKAKTNRLNRLDKQNISLTLNTQRVIHPSMDNEDDKKLKKTQKRICLSSERFMHSTDGRITSLIAKTPLTIEVKGKKRLNSSFDNLHSTLMNTTLDTSIGKEGGYNRNICETKRTGLRLFLNRSPFLTIETERTSGRKHFVNKNAKKVIID